MVWGALKSFRSPVGTKTAEMDFTCSYMERSLFGGLQQTFEGLAVIYVESHLPRAALLLRWLSG